MMTGKKEDYKVEDAIEEIVRLERNLDVMRKCAEFYDKKADSLSERLEAAERIIAGYDELLGRFAGLNKKMKELLRY